MRARRNRWFTIVATDMFSGAFAAIVLLDTITPKHMGLPSTAQEVRLIFPIQGGTVCPNADDGNALIFSFLDGGEPQSTIDKDFRATVIGNRCVVTGFLDIYFKNIEDPCILVTLPGKPPDRIDVEVTGVGYAASPPSCL